jgi:dUTPase
MKQKVKVKLLTETAQIPSRAHETDTGYDLTFIGLEKIVGDVIFFKTGISLEPPRGHYFDVVPRSSISKLPLAMANSIGIIDESYRGEILVPVRILHSGMGGEPNKTNFPNGIVQMFGFRPQTMQAVADLILKNSPKLFQAILRKRIDCEFLMEEDLTETIRGDGGFGSTGNK